jgi:hypothetical protein
MAIQFSKPFLEFVKIFKGLMHGKISHIGQLIESAQGSEDFVADLGRWDPGPVAGQQAPHNGINQSFHFPPPPIALFQGALEAGHNLFPVKFLHGATPFFHGNFFPHGNF